MVEHRLVPAYLQVLRDNTLKSYEASGFRMAPPIYEARTGLKYTKIMAIHGAMSNFQESIHSFVDEEGNVYKAASWRAPAKGVRYSLEQDMEILKERVDPYGGYLYKGAV